MKREQNRRQNDYAALKRKIFTRILIAAGCAVVAVVVFRMLAYGRMADWLVNTFTDIFRIDWDSASKIYHFAIRNYLELLFAVAIIVLVVVGFRLVIKSFTIYLDEIAEGIDCLNGDQDAEIKLSPELGAIENRLRNLQQTLLRRQQQSRQSEQRRNDLVIYSAHDIRTPLTSALGYLILLDGNPEMPAEERKKYTGIALAKTRELDSMINELFEITRYNLHDIALDMSPVDLCSLLLQMREEHYPQLQGGNKTLRLDVDEDTVVYGDAEKLARVFNNLLKNAIAYSRPDSAITVSARQSEESVTVFFQNQCDPIPQDQMDRIFDPFVRMKGSSAADVAGAGLGLAITKEILELHGGTIRAENTDGGVRFTMTLPTRPKENH